MFQPTDTPPKKYTTPPDWFTRHVEEELDLIAATYTADDIAMQYPDGCICIAGGLECGYCRWMQAHDYDAWLDDQTRYDVRMWNSYHE